MLLQLASISNDVLLPAAMTANTEKPRYELMLQDGVSLTIQKVSTILDDAVW